jgi:hypothetical protein
MMYSFCCLYSLTVCVGYVCLLCARSRRAVLMGEVVMGEDAAQTPYWQLSQCSSSMGSIGTT